MQRSWFERQMTVVILLMAALAGTALAVGLVRFDALHREFLGANYDSVHGARTLLKAAHFIALAEERMEHNAADANERRQQLDAAVEALGVAEHYSAEGHDADPQPRAELSRQLHELRQLVAAAALQRGADLAPLIRRARQLAEAFEAAELERWGTLSSLNGELSRRMSELRFLIGVLIIGLVVTLGLLGRALLVTRETEDELRTAKGEIEATQQTTLDASPIGIAYVDTADLLRSRIVKANRQMGVFFGAGLEQLVGQRLLDLIESSDLSAELGAAALQCVAAGGIVRCELRFRRADGSGFWGALSGKAVEPGEPGLGVVWTLENIDDRKRAERELQSAREQAESASRAKSEFVANISHEVRTPFTAILGVLDTLLRSPLDAEQKRFAELGQNSARQLLSIVNDILDISKIEAGKLTIAPTAIDLAAIVEETAAVHLAAASEKGIGFDHRLTGQAPPTLLADRVRLRQIIDNLLGNALKFTERGGVALNVHCAPAPQGNWAVRIEVSDSGIGIPSGLHEKIFEKFTQADSSTTRLYGGTGLGLAICRQLVMQMGGRIGLQSEPGVGSTFWVELTLPPSRGDAAAADDGASTTRGLRFDGQILLVDDNALVREASRGMLESFGVSVVVAASGPEALQHAERHDIDLVLMDCRMPEMDGFTAARLWRQRESNGQRTAIVAVSAEVDSVDARAYEAAGMDDFLAKPYNVKGLSGLLGRWLGPGT